MEYVIIENEQYAKENLQRMVEAIRPDWHLALASKTVEDSVAFFKRKHNVGLIFMDIELDDGTCFEIFNEVQIATPVIFTTAFDEYALKAFKVNSVDYLLKPVSEQDVKDALHKFESLQKQLQVDYGQLEKSFAEMKPHSRILISSGDNYGFVNVDDIAYFVSEDKYVYAHLLNGRRHLTEFSNLSDLMARLDTTRFFQISRNIISSIHSIAKVSKFFTGRLRVTLKSGNEEQVVVVSAARRHKFLDWLGAQSN